MSETRHPLRRQFIGLVVVVIIAGVTVGALLGAIGPQMFSGSGHTIDAVFANTQQLQTGDEIRISGVVSGSVDAVTLNPGGHSATVKMSIDSGAPQVYANASAILRWKTLLGSAFYIDLDRGTPDSGALAASGIPERHTSNQVELEDILSVDNGSARQGLKTLLPQLATGLSDPAPIAKTLDTLGAIAPTVGAGVGALRGEKPTQDYDLEGLVTNTAGVLKVLNAPDDELQGLIQGAAATLGVTAARADDLETALDEATPAMAQTRTTFRQLNTTLTLAKPLLDKLKTAAPAVAPTFADVRPTLTGAKTLLQRAVPLLRALPRGTSALASASKVGLPLLKELTPDLDSLQGSVLPYLNAQDPQTQHSTAEMIGPTFEALGPDIAGQEDENGHFIRFPLSTGSSPLYLNCQTYINNPSATQLLACESLQQSLGEILGSPSTLASSLSGSSTTAATTTTTTSGGATPLVSRSSTIASVTDASGVSTVASQVSTTASSIGSSVGSLLSNVGSSVSNVLGKSK